MLRFLLKAMQDIYSSGESHCINRSICIASPILYYLQDARRSKTLQRLRRGVNQPDLRVIQRESEYLLYRIGHRQ